MKTTPEGRKTSHLLNSSNMHSLPPSPPPSPPPSLLLTEEEGPETHAEEEGKHHVFPPLGAKAGDWAYSRRKWKDGGW
jgi:hypothetical protein